MKHLTYSLASCLCVVALAACSRNDTGSVTRVPVTIAPPGPTVLAGVAARGAALDGAVIEVIDANGNRVTTSKTVTGSDGSYRVVLPNGTALPVIIRATPPGGTPLLSIVPKSSGSSTGEIVANVNPITNLVSDSVLKGANASDNGSLAKALSGVDTQNIATSGTTILRKVLGNSVNYAAFASDPNFVASNGTSSGSPADAILDTLAQQAQSAGKTTAQALNDYAASTNPPKLLNQPDFEIGLVSNMVEKGSNPAKLETQLSSLGALPAPSGNGGTDLFRTVIAAVPTILDSVKKSAADASKDPALVKVVEDAAVNLIKDTITTKQSRFNANANDIAKMLASGTFQSTATQVIDQNVAPVINSLASDPNASMLLDTVTRVVGTISQQASQVASSFDYGSGTADVSKLVAGYVKQKVTGGQTISVSTLDAIESGSTTLDSVVKSSGDVSSIQKDIVNYAASNPDLVNGDVSTVIQTLPAGKWDESNWDQFNWG